jgi:hypothetical protein
LELLSKWNELFRLVGSEGRLRRLRARHKNITLTHWRIGRKTKAKIGKEGEEGCEDQLESIVPRSFVYAAQKLTWSS